MIILLFIFNHFPKILDRCQIGVKLYRPKPEETPLQAPTQALSLNEVNIIIINIIIINDELLYYYNQYYYN